MMHKHPFQFLKKAKHLCRSNSSLGYIQYQCFYLPVGAICMESLTIQMSCAPITIHHLIIQFHILIKINHDGNYGSKKSTSQQYSPDTWVDNNNQLYRFNDESINLQSEFCVFRRTRINWFLTLSILRDALFALFPARHTFFTLSQGTHVYPLFSTVYRASTDPRIVANELPSHF